MVAAVLGRRALNRATLARQLLLDRSPMSPLDAVGRLVGLQAQVPSTPTPRCGHASTASSRRSWRGCSRNGRSSAPSRCGRRSTSSPPTTAWRCARWCSRCSTRSWRATPSTGRPARRRRRPGARGGAAAPGRTAADGGQLRAALAEQFPELDAPAAPYACRYLLALVQVPPRGLWGRSVTVRSTTAEAWLGRPLAAAPSIDRARAALPRRLRPCHRRRRGDLVAPHRPSRGRGAAPTRARHVPRRAGRELFDLPDAPRPDPDTPAPPRFLPEYDNVLLSHSDRSRFVPEGRVARFSGIRARADPGNVLHDGSLFGVWRFEVGGTRRRHATPQRAQARGVAAEGRRFLRFLGGDDEDVRVRPAPLSQTGDASRP